MVVDSVCTYCGVGCEISAEVGNNSINKIYSKKEGRVSEGKLCIKGKYGYEFLTSPNRVDGAFVSADYLEKNSLTVDGDKVEIQGRDFLKVPYKTAYNLVANGIERVKNKYSKYAYCSIGAARTSCESGFLMQKFAREVVGSPNVDNCARVCHSPSLKGMRKTIGEGAATNPFSDLYNSEFFLVIGSNTTEAHPIVASKLIKAKRDSGAEIVTVDIREIGLSKQATHHLSIPYESNLLVLNMMARVIIEEGLENREFIESRGKYFDEYRNSIMNDPYADPEFFRGVKGYENLADLIPKVARLYATKKSMILWGLGVTEHLDGSYAVMAISHLALLTGNIGKSGTGLMPLRGQNNVQGACDVGMLPYYNPDYTQPKEVGKMTPELIDGMLAGEIKALYNMGEDIAHIHPNLNKIHKALDQLDLLVVNEVMLNETTKFADIIFGVKSQYEKSGVYVNAERRLHLSQPLVDSDLPDDWEVIQEISKRLGSEWNYEKSEDVWNDARVAVNNRYGGASYEKLTEKRLEGMQWPVAETDTPILHIESFRTKDGLGHFHYHQWAKRGQVEELLEKGKNDFYLSTGRILEHYNNAVQTKESGRLLELHSTDTLLVSVDDEVFNGVKTVKLSSPYGESAELPIKQTKKIKKGTIFTTFHHPESKINFLFGDEADELIKTARFKSVKVEVTF